MKRIHTILALAATLAAFASCSKENNAAVGNTAGKALSINVGTETKTLLRNGSNVHWSSSDQLCVFDNNNTGFTFKTTSAYSDKSVAVFTCDDYTGGTPKMAVNCWSTYVPQSTYDGTNRISSYLNPAQKIAHKASYSMFASLAVGEISGEPGSYAVENMKQCFSLLQFSLVDTSVVSITVKGNKNEILAGGVDINYSSIDGGNDFWTSNTAVGPAAKEITLTASGSACNEKGKGSFADTTYYVSILPQTLANGVTFVMTRRDGKTATREINSSITLNRAKIVKMKHPVDSGLVYKASNIVLDCTNAANFRYDNGGTETAFPTSDHGKNYVTGDFWLKGLNQYVFNGSVKNWGNTLNAASGDLVKLPSISGYTLTEVNVTYSKASADRTYRISDGENTLFKCTRNSSTTEETKMDLTGTPLNPPTHPERYISSSGEMCVKFILTYTSAE